MGQSFVKNYLHITFSTKYRNPMIDSYIEPELHAYLGGVCNEMGCIPLKVGGYTEHVHILCNLSKNITLAKLMKIVKSHSSKWIKTKGSQYANFYWQDGYGAFSVNPSQTDRVVQYIHNQHAHHQQKTFKKEFLQLLHKYKVPYDERYIWD